MLVFRRDGSNTKISVRTVEAQDPLVLVNIELIVISDPPVIFESLGTSGLLIERSHRDIADLEQLWSCKEDEIDRVMIDGVDDTALIEEDCGVTAFLNFDSAGESGGTGSDDRYIKLFHVFGGGELRSEESSPHALINGFERRR